MPAPDDLPSDLSPYDAAALLAGYARLLAVDDQWRAGGQPLLTPKGVAIVRKRPVKVASYGREEAGRGPGEGHAPGGGTGGGQRGWTNHKRPLLLPWHPG